MDIGGCCLEPGCNEYAIDKYCKKHDADSLKNICNRVIKELEIGLERDINQEYALLNSVLKAIEILKGNINA